MNEPTRAISRPSFLRWRIISQQVQHLLSDQEKNVQVISLAVCAAAGVGILFYIYLAIQVPVWQNYALIGLTTALLVVALASLILARRGRSNLGIWLLLVVGQISVAVSPVFTGRQGVWFGAGILMATLIISTVTMRGRQATWANFIGLAAAIATLSIDYQFQGYQLPPPVILTYFIPAVVGVLTLIYLFIVALYFFSFNLRVKIIIAVLGATIFSIFVLAVISNNITRRELTKAVNQTLMMAAEATGENIDEYLDNLTATLSEDVLSHYPRTHLTLAEEERLQNLDANTYLLRLKGRGEAFDYLLFDRSGKVVLHTTQDPQQLPAYMGFSITDIDKFKISVLTGEIFISSIYFPKNGAEPFFYVGKGVYDIDGKPLGLLAGSFSLEPVQAIINNANNLAGQGSFAVLLDTNGMRIGDGRAPEVTYKLISPLEQTELKNLQDGGRLPAGPLEELYTDFPAFSAGLMQSGLNPFFSTQEVGTGDEVNAAAAIKLKNQPWLLTFMQPEAVFLQPVFDQTRATILAAVVITGLAILGALFLANLLAQPIMQLTTIAGKAAGGNLFMRAPVESQDEIGTLSTAFNTMINQLHQTMEGLERRVNERTSELARTSEQMEHRANRLQMVAEVAQAIAAVQDPSELLPKVADTISEHFGYYHVGIFLLDREEEYAVLQASNSEGGKRMLARGHRLKVGEVGIVGYVCGKGEARIALDVGRDAIFFDNPDLPQTRSEIALPLKAGTKVTGALDVQSTEPEAFTQDDIALLSTLANQVAMAIENARLFSETQLTLRELQTAQQQFLRQGWEKTVAESQYQGYRYLFGQLKPLTVGESSVDWESLQHMEDAVVTKVREDGGRQPNSLLVPITLRNQVIGMIDLEETEGARQWGEEELSLARSVADQVGLALENARLLEVTRRRAERERMVADITTKLRASNDPQTILETAVLELKHALRARSVQVRVPGGEASPVQDK